MFEGIVGGVANILVNIYRSSGSVRLAYVAQPSSQHNQWVYDVRTRQFVVDNTYLENVAEQIIELSGYQEQITATNVRPLEEINRDDVQRKIKEVLNTV